MRCLRYHVVNSTMSCRNLWRRAGDALAPSRAEPLRAGAVTTQAQKSTNEQLNEQCTTQERRKSLVYHYEFKSL